MSTPAEVIHQYLLDHSLGSNVAGADWQMFISFLPDSPDNAIAVLDTAGIADGRIMSTGERIEHSGIQIQLRGLSYADTYAKAQAITASLDSASQVLVAVESGSVYMLDCVSRTGTIIPIGIEDINDKRRNLFTINMTLTMSEQT